MDTMLVDCTGCAARGPACSECVVSVLLGMPDAAGVPALDADEKRALDALANGGLLPPLRLVHSVERLPLEQPRREGRRRASG